MSERIPLVIGIADDEPMIRRGVSQLLRELVDDRLPNHELHVEEFERASDVVDFVADYPEDLDLLVLDVDFRLTGGGETGIEILPLLMGERPDLAVCLLTGSADDQDIAEAGEHGVVQYHQKPVTKDELARQLFLLIRATEGERSEQRAMWKALDAKFQERAKAKKPAKPAEHDADEAAVLRKVFPNLQFHARALDELRNAPGRASMGKCLVRLDRGEDAVGGERRRPFHAVPGVLEIRIDQACRVFVASNARGYAVLAFTAQHEHVRAPFRDTLKRRLTGLNS
ncbi:MAG: CheY-like chemotaxis protein [Bradymonadia bacterium]|jgi:CheY-like chemotaxis protein